MKFLFLFLSEHFWAVASAMITVTTFLTGLVNKYVNPSSVWKQIISWDISFALTLIVFKIGIIQAASPVWLSIVFTAVIIGMASNGFYDIPFIKKIVKAVTGKE